MYGFASPVINVGDSSPSGTNETDNVHNGSQSFFFPTQSSFSVSVIVHQLVLIALSFFFLKSQYILIKYIFNYFKLTRIVLVGR